MVCTIPTAASQGCQRDASAIERSIAVAVASANAPPVSAVVSLFIAANTSSSLPRAEVTSTTRSFDEGAEVGDDDEKDWGGAQGPQLSCAFEDREKQLSLLTSSLLPPLEPPLLLLPLLQLSESLSPLLPRANAIN